MFKHTIPSFIRSMVPYLTWKVHTEDKIVYLTFDDGPHPTITPWVMDMLKVYDAKATFFCVGENVQRFPSTFRAILDNNHAIGNHTFNHLNGWVTQTQEYLRNIDLSAQLINSKLFRPPYGRITPWQLFQLKRNNYQVIMWDVLTCDYEPNLNIQKAVKSCMKHIQPGSIIVMHDSLKAEVNLRQLLPQFLETLKNQGYQFKSLPS